MAGCSVEKYLRRPPGSLTNSGVPGNRWDLLLYIADAGRRVVSAGGVAVPRG